MKNKVLDEPGKFTDYTLENGQLYRNMGYRADDSVYPSPTEPASYTSVMIPRPQDTWGPKDD